jgi:hypothetical protein
MSMSLMLSLRRRLPLPAPLEGRDPLEDIFLGLLLDAPYPCQPVLGGRLLKLREARHLQFVVDGLGGFRSQGGNGQQRENTRRDLALELFVGGHGAGLEILLDLRRQIRPDAGNLQQFLVRQLSQVAREPLQVEGRLAIGPDLEGVILPYLEDVGDVGEHPGDFPVLHSNSR